MFFFSVLILLFPFYNYPLFYDSTIIPELSVIKIVGIITIIGALLYIPRSKDLRSRAFNGIFLSLFLFLIWVLLNSYLFRNIGNPIALQSLIAILGFMIAFVILVDSKERARRVILLYMAAMGLACYRAYHELILYLPLYPGFRPSSTIGDPNYFSIAMVPAIALTFGMISESMEEGDKRKSLFYIAVLAYFLLPFIFAASRGAAVGLLFSLLVLFLASRRRWRNFVVAILFLVISMPLLRERFIERFMTLFGTESAKMTGTISSNEIRMKLLEGGLRIIREKWDFGIGAGDFKQRIGDFYPEIGEEGLIAHNTYIEVFAEHGIVGIMLFLVIVFGIGRSLLGTRFYRREEDKPSVEPLVISLYAGVTGYLFASLFLSVQYDRFFYLIISTAIIFLSVFRQGDRMGSISLRERPNLMEEQ